MAAGLVALTLPAAHAQDYKPEEQYKYTPNTQQAPNQPANQYQQYKAPDYKPPEYKPPQYPQYPQYPAPKGPSGQYRGSPQDQQACINDVFRLCNQFVPDVSRIVSCLQSNKKKLSPACRSVFSRKNKGK